MAAGKPDEIGGKLNSLNEIPEGFQFRKEMIWQSLEQNLHPIRKSRALFYYAAAAVIILLILLGYFLSLDSSPINRQQPIVIQPQPPEPIKNTVKTEPPKTVPHTVPAAIRANDKVQRNNREITVQKNKLDADSLSLTNLLPTILPDEVARILASDSSAGEPPKKSVRKFPIAHINELNQPAAPIDSWKPENVPVKKPLLATVNTLPVSVEDQPPVVPRKQRGIISIKSQTQ